MQIEFYLINLNSSNNAYSDSNNDYTALKL